MRRLPPLAELRAFEAAARHLSFKGAAAELAVTPTAVSHQIRLLEQYCGCALFRRHPRPLCLTEAGARLFPAVRDGLDGFAAALTAIVESAGRRTLIVTTTNAFASLWLVPRLPMWREEHPDIALEVIGTDAVLDLRAGEADLAIRYMHNAPDGLLARELFRDRYFAVCSPAVLPGGRPLARLADLAGHTLVHCYWSPSDSHAPTWERWLAMARAVDPETPQMSDMRQLSFREELHAIDAVLASQGMAVCSDLLVGRELASGTLVKASDLALPGYGYYLVHAPEPSRPALIEAFSRWARAVP